MLKKISKIAGIVLASFLVLIMVPVLLLWMGIAPRPPEAPCDSLSAFSSAEPVEIAPGLMVLGNNWFRQNRHGMWELYAEGDAFNRGVAIGKLTRDLVNYQEEVFIAQINKVLPSKHYQRILQTLIMWINKDLDHYIPMEFKKEIYGISRSANEDYDRFGPAYVRMMNYHAAHDIGHAMQSYYLVGCSSFAGWNEMSADSGLIIGRNFDFYFGDDFSRHKIVEFIKPDTGYNFAFVTWGGMAGVASGMNTAGLTVTINAGTLSVGKKSATPVTLLAREILQFAANTQEAEIIASARNIAVAESFLIGSATDHIAILIEKKPGAQDVVNPDSSSLICTNHFQSEDFLTAESNKLNRDQNATGYRFQRLDQLVGDEILSPERIACILRNKDGLNDQAIGYGNEKALNQFIAHHAVIFKPGEQLMWVSTRPNVMGAFVAYDLNKIFSAKDALSNHEVDETGLEIAADPFMQSDKYRNFLTYRLLSNEVQESVKANRQVPDSILTRMISMNPDYFQGYELTADYYFSRGKRAKAAYYYREALQKEVSSAAIINNIQEQIKKCN
jgi:hypothetical protein